MSNNDPGKSHVPSHPSANFDVNWLAGNDFTRIQKEGAAPVNVTWITELYTWIHKRRGADSIPKPVSSREWNPHHNGYFPILWCQDAGEKAGVSFMSVWPAPREETSTLPQKPQEQAANAALDWGQENIHVNSIGGLGNISRMRVLVRPDAIDQNSDCLAAFVATILIQIGDNVTDDVCATGEWDIAEQRFKPVGGFDKKIRAAREWGYRKLFYVEGQTEVPKSAENLLLIPLPTDPEQAAEMIRNRLQPKSDRIARNIRWLINLAVNASMIAFFFAILLFQEWILPALSIRPWIEGAVLGAVGIACLFGALRSVLNRQSPVMDRIFAACVVFFIIGFSAICLFDFAGLETPKVILWPWLLTFFFCGAYGLLTQGWKMITS